jgi:hypothetical protein
MRPVPFDVSNQATVNSWMSLPWYGPEFVSLPGLRTFGKGRKANGSEMFLAATTLMASGTRTIMLPRWPTGGATALGLTRLYSEHLSQKMSGPKAIRKAMIEARDLNFDITKEPQIKDAKDPGVISLEHPFFWASFFVVDQPRLKVPEAEPAMAMPVAPKPSGVTTPAPTPAPTVSPAPTNTPGGVVAPVPPAKNTDEKGEASKSDVPENPDAAAGIKPPASTAEGDSKPTKPKAAPRKNGGIF